MDQFRAGGFMGDDTLLFNFEASGFLTIKGEISCRGNILIRVEKNLVVLEDGTPDPLVQTVDYAYNASVRGHGNILRHDNLHPYPGHQDEHHRHEFDWRTGQHVASSPSWVGTEGWPTLSEFIEEVERWYWEHKDELLEPEKLADLGARG
jgi:hypothetical protein